MKIDNNQIAKIEALLTSLKRDSMGLDYNPYGDGIADRQIKAIDATLKAFGASFYYDGDLKAKIVIA